MFCQLFGGNTCELLLIEKIYYTFVIHKAPHTYLIRGPPSSILLTPARFHSNAGTGFDPRLFLLVPHLLGMTLHSLRHPSAFHPFPMWLWMAFHLHQGLCLWMVKFTDAALFCQSLHPFCSAGSCIPPGLEFLLVPVPVPALARPELCRPP